ncbi:hypothetical protein WDW89_24975 [Deltaproteobacteria bacterium TL4]
MAELTTKPYDTDTGQWKSEGEVIAQVVPASNSGRTQREGEKQDLQVSFKTKHLSYFNLDYFRSARCQNTQFKIKNLPPEVQLRVKLKAKGWTKTLWIDDSFDGFAYAPQNLETTMTFYYENKVILERTVPDLCAAFEVDFADTFGSIKMKEINISFRAYCKNLPTQFNWGSVYTTYRKKPEQGERSLWRWGGSLSLGQSGGSAYGSSSIKLKLLVGQTYEFLIRGWARYEGKYYNEGMTKEIKIDDNTEEQKIEGDFEMPKELCLVLRNAAYK